jgi:hypothetical protein
MLLWMLVVVEEVMEDGLNKKTISSRSLDDFRPCGD